MLTHLLRRLLLLALISLGLISQAFSQPASAATLTVPAQYTTIQAAINAAVNGDTVLISDGTYTGPGNVDLDFGGRNITVTSVNGAAATIIDCQGSSSANHRGFYLHSGETNAVISGLIIQNGYVSNSNSGNSNGGGICEAGSGITIQNCIFKNNTTTYGFGGGIYASTGYGSMSSSGSATAVINCVFAGNMAGYGGGALYGGNPNGSPFSVTNCTMMGNTKNRYGNAVENASYPSAAGAIAFTNDIIYGDNANGGGEILNEGNGTANATFAYCDIQGGYVGTGNINTDPIFAASPTDLHLQQSSPCVGAGIASGAPTLTVDGKARPNPPSIGAYEASSTLSVPSQYATIQDAVNAAASGSVILIADGTYSGPGNADIDFGGKTLTVTSQHGAASTIVDCQGSAGVNHRGFFLHSGEINPVISGLTIQNGYGSVYGTVSIYGGGIYDTSMGLTVQNCIFKNNTAVYGGGIYSSEYRGTLTLTNCVFTGNSAATGGGVYGGSGSAVTIINCTVTGNTASGNPANFPGGGLYYTGFSNSNYPNGSGPVTLTNDIFYGDSSGEIGNNGNGAPIAVATTCDIQNGYTGTGNISADPLFVSSPSNLHLAAGSPCLGMGTAFGAPTVTIDGQARPNPPSIGAYELSPTTTTVASSINPSVSGSGITFTASVSPNIPGSGSPTGTITFTVDGYSQPPVMLAYYGTPVGMAGYYTTSLAVGSHTVIAAYSGDSQFAPSVSPVLTQTVVPHLAPQYVSPAGSDSNPGTQAAPKLTIQAALNVCLTGDTVFVGDGTYTGPGDVDLVMNGQSIIVASLNGPARTIINCAGTSTVNHRGFSFDAEASPTISGLTIENGYEAGGGVYGGGGAIVNYSPGLIIKNCVIKNSTAVEGGGVYSVLSSGTISFINCVLTGNTAVPLSPGSSSGSFGGGISSHTSINGGGTLSMTNCTVTGNTASNGSGGLFMLIGTASLSNTIFYSDIGGELYGGSTLVSYCDVQGGYTGTNNINADPLFVNPTSDLHLSTGSPCLGMGTASGAPTTTIDGKTRPNPPSIGAYEAYPIPTLLSVSPVSGTAGQSVSLSATLSFSGTGTVLSGKTVSFSVDGVAVGTAVTGGNGVATLPYTIPAGTTAGSHTITASFAGDSGDQPASGTGTLTVSAPPPPVGQMRFFPRIGKESRMVGGQFQGSHDNSTWTTLATVAQTPPTNQYSTLPTSADPATFRYLRYLAPSGAYGNVAEVEFDSHGVKLTGTAFGTAGSYNNSGNTFQKALDGSTSTFFDAPYPGNSDYVGIDQGPTYTKLTGTAFGTAGSYNNSGNTYMNVFDGNLSTFFDAPYPGTGDYAGVDLGAGQTAVVTRIDYCPRSGYTSRMVGGVFQGSNDASAWTTLYTVTSAPAAGVLTRTTSISSTLAFRYLRYLAPNGGYGNVAEVEFNTSP